MNIFKGRINRTTFLLGNLVFVGVAILLSNPITFKFLEGYENNWLVIVLVYAILVALLGFGFSLRIKRLHDLGLTGWLWPITILPAADIVLLVLRGKKNDNRYGSPHKKQFDFSALF